MAMPENVILENYKYTISDITLTANNFEEPVIVRKDFVKSLVFIHNYDKNIAPKVQLIFQVDKNEYEKIITNTDSLTATFDIYKIFVGVVSSGNISEDEDVDQEHPWKSLNLKAMNANELSTYEMNQLNNENNSDELTESPIPSQSTAIVTLYLYDKDILKKTHESKYYIMNGGKNDIIYHFFKDRDLSNILMTPTDNISTTYITPCGTLNENLKYLNTYYGIYNTPYVFYMDFNCIYLLEKGSVGNTLKANELPSVHIYVEKDNDSGYSQSGSFVDNDNGIYVLNANSFNISNNDADIDYAIGGTIKTVISGTGDIKTDKIGDYDVERTVVVDNEKQHSQLIYSIKESKRNMTLSFSNIDLDIITPNKKYVLLADDTYYKSSYKLNGDYRMTTNVILFRRSTENELATSCQITINKIP